MGKGQSKTDNPIKKSAVRPITATAINQSDGREKITTTNTPSPPQKINNEDLTAVGAKTDQRKVSIGGAGGKDPGKRRLSRIDKLKSRKLPHVLKVQIIEEDELKTYQHGITLGKTFFYKVNIFL